MCESVPWLNKNEVLSLSNGKLTTFFKYAVDNVSCLILYFFYLVWSNLCGHKMPICAPYASCYSKMIKQALRMPRMSYGMAVILLIMYLYAINKVINKHTK